MSSLSPPSSTVSSLPVSPSTPASPTPSHPPVSESTIEPPSLPLVHPPIRHQYSRRDPAVPPPSPVFSMTEVPSHTYSLRDRSTLVAPDRYASTSVSVAVEPSTYREAVQSPKWRTAMAEELNALARTHTWDLVPLPARAIPITCRWIYKVKTQPDGSVERYKARLVALGFQQEYGRDYEETFAPVAHMQTVRTLVAVAAVRGWQLT